MHRSSQPTRRPAGYGTSGKRLWNQLRAPRIGFAARADLVLVLCGRLLVRFDGNAGSKGFPNL